jgi:signal transduction histidine kinase
MMRERASQLNGRFEVESTPGRGTTIRVVVPFR